MGLGQEGAFTASKHRRNRKMYLVEIGRNIPAEGFPSTPSCGGRDGSWRKDQKGQYQRRETKSEHGMMEGLQTTCVMGTAWAGPWAVAHHHGREKPLGEQMQLSVPLWLFSSFFKWPQCVLGTVALNTSPAEPSGPAYPCWAPMDSSKFLELPQECSKQQRYSISRVRSVGSAKLEWLLSIKLRLGSCICNREALKVIPIIYYFLL